MTSTPPPSPPSGGGAYRPGAVGPGQAPGAGAGGLPSRVPNGFGIAAAVLGVIGVLLTLTFILSPVGVLLAIAAIVFGVLGLSQARRFRAMGRAAALTGLVAGVLTLVFAAVLTVRISAFATRHSDDFSAFSRCIGNARTDAQRSTCAQQLSDRLGQG